MARRQRHTMTSVRWTGLTLGALALVLTFLVTGDVTARFTMGMGVGLGVVILAISEGIVAHTRRRPETSLANIRMGGSIGDGM